MIVNCSVVANTGDGIQSCGQGASSTEISNCLVAGNGAVGIFLTTMSSVSIISGCTITQNVGNGLQIEQRSLVAIANSIVGDNLLEQIRNVTGVLTVTYSDIKGGWPGEGNVDCDPCFVATGYWVDSNDANIPVEPNDPNSLWIEGDYHLQPESPCIDAGDNTRVALDSMDLDGDSNKVEPVPFDVDGNERFVDLPGVPDTGNPSAPGPIVDMGAYEYE